MYSQRTLEAGHQKLGEGMSRRFTASTRRRRQFPDRMTLSDVQHRAEEEQRDLL